MKPLQLSSPHLIIMVGAPGAGKTQFATEFAKMFNAPMLSSDTLRELSSDDALIHKAAIDLLRELLKPKQTIIFDGNTEKRAWRSDIAKVAREAGFKPLFVWVQTDPAMSRARWLRSHNGDEALFEQKLRTFSPPHASEPYMVISGRHTYNTQAKTLLKKLSDATRPAASIRTQPRFIGGRGRVG